MDYSRLNSKTVKKAITSIPRLIRTVRNVLQQASTTTSAQQTLAVVAITVAVVAENAGLCKNVSLRAMYRALHLDRIISMRLLKDIVLHSHFQTSPYTHLQSMWEGAEGINFNHYYVTKFPIMHVCHVLCIKKKNLVLTFKVGVWLRIWVNKWYLI